MVETKVHSDFCPEGLQRKPLGICDHCTPEKRRTVIVEACEEVLTSVEDRRENGGTVANVRTKGLRLIELLFADLAE